MNKIGHLNTSSKYKGVSWEASRQCWAVQIKVDGKSKHLGRFNNEHNAAEVYNNAAKQYFGEYANLNPIERK